MPENLDLPLFHVVTLEQFETTIRQNVRAISSGNATLRHLNYELTALALEPLMITNFQSPTKRLTDKLNQKRPEMLGPIEQLKRGKDNTALKEPQVEPPTVVKKNLKNTHKE